MRCLYTLLIRLYGFMLWVASPFCTRARQWREGRLHLFDTLENNCRHEKQILCVHCASLGEFEQGKPLIQKIKKEYPHYTLMITFFSPSGYMARKNDPDADIVSYLPIDLPSQMKRFLDIVNPKAFIFIKYEYWFNLMSLLHERSIPFDYVSAVFRPQQRFFRWWGKWFARHLCYAHHFFVQDEASRQLLLQQGIEQVTVTGDTRFDRVKEIAEHAGDLPFAKAFKDHAKLIVAGSTWKPDEKILQEVMDSGHSATPDNPRYKLIIAPHIVEQKHVEALQRRFAHHKTILYTDREKVLLKDYDVLIINSIGLLSRLYQYADIAYVGGGFHTGLHNIIEAAVYGCPLFFGGKKYRHFNEAVALVNLGGAFAIHKSKEMIQKLQSFQQKESEYQNIHSLCQSFVEKNTGASCRVLDILKKEWLH
jgi:3-deoxy-D-manno-octulosonic-acid transferase